MRLVFMTDNQFRKAEDAYGVGWEEDISITISDLDDISTGLDTLSPDTEERSDRCRQLAMIFDRIAYDQRKG